MQSAQPAIKRLKRAVVKEEFVALTGDVVKAIILNQFVYWSERVNDFDQFVIEEKRRAEQNGVEVNFEPNKGWIYKTAKELSEETMLNLAESNMRKHMKFLIQQEWLTERTNPNYKWDRTKQYRVNLFKIQNDLLAIGYVLQDYKVELPFFKTQDASSKTEDGAIDLEDALSCAEDASSKLENQNCDLKDQNSRSERAIPEITYRDYNTEITNQQTNQRLSNQDHVSLADDLIATIEKPVRGLVENSLRLDITDRAEKASVTAEQIIKEIGRKTGTCKEQVQKAIGIVNRMNQEKKVRSNYLKLVEVVARTIQREDLLKQPGCCTEKDKDLAQKAFLNELYMS